jgi:hypothetical protein
VAGATARFRRRRGSPGRGRVGEQATTTQRGWPRCTRLRSGRARWRWRRRPVRPTAALLDGRSLWWLATATTARRSCSPTPGAQGRRPSAAGSRRTASRGTPCSPAMRCSTRSSSCLRSVSS